MPRTIVSLIAGLAIASATGCDKKQDNTAASDRAAPAASVPSTTQPASTNPIVAQAEGFAARACDCRDVPCSVAMANDWLAFRKANAGRQGKPEDKARYDAAAQRLATCYTNVTGKDAKGLID